MLVFWPNVSSILTHNVSILTKCLTKWPNLGGANAPPCSPLRTSMTPSRISAHSYDHIIQQLYRYYSMCMWWNWNAAANDYSFRGILNERDPRVMCVDSSSLICGKYTLLILYGWHHWMHGYIAINTARSCNHQSTKHARYRCMYVCMYVWALR